MGWTTTDGGDRFAAAMGTARRIAAAKYRAVGPEEREDLVADVMAKYIATFPSGNPGPEHPTAWLRQTLSTTFIDRWRAEKIRPSGRGDDESYDAPGVDDDGRNLPFLVNALRMSPSVMSAWVDVEERVMAGLSQDDRDLFWAKDIDRVPARELAVTLGISVTAVEKRASRIRAALRITLEASPELLAELRAGMPQVHQHRPR